MPSLIKAISVQWDLWIGQYRAFFPTAEEDLQACKHVVAEVGRGMPGRMPGESTPGPAEGAIPFQMAACQDTRSGAVIACLRLTDAAAAQASPEARETYQLDLFTEDQLAGMTIFEDLAVLPSYRKTSAAMVLMSHCFIESLKAGGQAVLMSCEPELFPTYKHLGMRPIGTLHSSPHGGLRLPMICLPDQEYLSIIQSPALPLLRGVDFERFSAICQWYYQLVRDRSELQIGAAFYPESEEDFEGHHTITEGLSEKGREVFLKNAMVLNCQEGEVLITENEGGNSFGYVSKGMVKVLIGEKTVVLLGEGDIIGELAFILNTKRTARVVAASPETEVVLFSESAVNRLKEESDRTIIWRNLARVLAQRVMLTNKLLG